MVRWLGGWSLVLACLAALPASAAEPETLALHGNTLAGRSFDLAMLRGKVVLVFFWRTDCAVCLSKLPELRLNAAGWRSKPFELVLVNADPKRGDAAEYEALEATLHPGTYRYPSLWRGDAAYADSLPVAPTRVPLSLLLDAGGQVVARFEGRIPAEAWDRIADLLP